MQKIHKNIVILSFFFAFSSLGMFYVFSNEKNEHFSYSTGQNDVNYIQITTGNSLSVPFSFYIGDLASEVKLEIENDILLHKGVSLGTNTAIVKNGIAVSQALFAIPSKNELQPGTYYLKIKAKNNVTGKVIRTGEIPFIVDMANIIAKCSC